MAEDLDETVEYVHTTFIPTNHRAVEVIEKRLIEHRPDLVVIPVGTYTFLMGLVWLKVSVYPENAPVGGFVTLNSRLTHGPTKKAPSVVGSTVLCGVARGD